MRGGLQIYNKGIGNVSRLTKSGTAKENLGYMESQGVYPTLHQMRVYPNGAPQSLSIGSQFLCEICPHEAKQDAGFLSLGG